MKVIVNDDPGGRPPTVAECRYGLKLIARARLDLAGKRLALYRALLSGASAEDATEILQNLDEIEQKLAGYQKQIDDILDGDRQLSLFLPVTGKGGQ
jgi:hypothetical protein